MHFWIDKRSQACGFGRARVAASLSGGGGLGFGHPRRVPRKSMVTPIHRFQTVDCTRPHFYRHQQQQQSQSQANSTHNNNSSTSSQQHQHQSQSHHQQYHHNSHHNQNHHQQPVQPVAAQSANQQVHQVQLHSSGHYNTHSPSILPAPTPYPQASPNLQSNASPSNNAHNYHVPVSMNHIYSASAQTSGADIEQGGSNLGIAAIAQHAQPQLGQDAQLLPAHLKCGMWASLALATVFVAGAKFYFDHQGTGLEVLIFCAFSATFFLAACTVSLWRRPRELPIPGNNVISETISNAEQSSLQNNPELMSSNPSPLLNGSVGGGISGGGLHVAGQHQHASLASIVAPPPPYHIAILLPEATKDTDETPPPSYDKIVI